MPRLTGKSLLYDLLKDRCVTLEKYWLSMGWPLSGMVPQRLSKKCPHDITNIKVPHQKRLTGNGINVLSFGAVAYWAMGIPRWKKP